MLSIEEVQDVKAEPKNKPKKKPPSQKTETLKKCERCGKGAHKNQADCKAMTVKCFKCGRKEHYSECCLSKKPQSRGNKSKVDDVQQSSNDDIYYIESIVQEVTKQQLDEWMVTLQINSTNVSLKLDAGAQVNILPHSDISN